MRDVPYTACCAHAGGIRLPATPDTLKSGISSLQRHIIDNGAANGNAAA